MKIRPATSRDAAAIMSIRVAVRENVLDRERLEALGITEESIGQMLTGSHPGWCGEEEGRVIAFSMADREAGTIFALFVHPDFEGRGAGSALLKVAVGYLAEVGHEVVRLTTEPGTRAFRFYRARGWRDTGLDDRGEAKFELHLDDTGEDG